GRNPMKYAKHSLCVLTVVLASAASERQPAPTNDRVHGLSSTTFQTAAGTVRLNLPDDLAAGDNISGTVYVVPKGTDGSKEQRRNGDELNGYVFRTGNTRIPVKAGMFQWAVPAAVGGGVAAFELLNGKGKVMAATEVTVATAIPMPAQKLA